MNCTHFIFIGHLLMLTYFLCGKCSRISILLLVIYWCWLYFMCKMLLSFLIDVYVIFFDWNISINCTHFIFIGHYHLLMWVGNVFGHVCVSVCLCVCLSVFLSVQAITFEPLDIETSFLVCRYILTISRSSLSIKVIGSRSRSYEKKW